MSKVNITHNNEEVLITGMLTQDTVMRALSKCKSLLGAAKKLTLNLTAVTQCDSASIAFLVALMRESKITQTQILFANLPKQMQDLVSVSGLENILPIIKS